MKERMPLTDSHQRSVIETLSLNRPLRTSLKENIVCAAFHPRKFIAGRPFALVCGLYTATFGVANVVETLATEYNKTALGTLTFLSVLSVNVPLGIWKDLKFADMYGTRAAAATTPQQLQPQRPRAAVAAFLFRDAATIFSSFCLAPSLATAMPDSIASSSQAKATMSQVTVPMAAQLVATPAHLVGVDLYSTQNSTWGEKTSRVGRDFPSAALIRCVRVLPTFGLGCVLNREIRNMADGGGAMNAS